MNLKWKIIQFMKDQHNKTGLGFHFNSENNFNHPYEYDPKHVINEIIKTKAKCNYLEIGVDQGATFDHIDETTLKHGVDPFGECPNITHRMTSQMFFSMNSYFFKNKYDIIFCYFFCKVSILR